MRAPLVRDFVVCIVEKRCGGIADNRNVIRNIRDRVSIIFCLVNR